MRRSGRLASIKWAPGVLVRVSCWRGPWTLGSAAGPLRWRRTPSLMPPIPQRQWPLRLRCGGSRHGPAFPKPVGSCCQRPWGAAPDRVGPLGRGTAGPQRCAACHGWRPAFGPGLQANLQRPCFPYLPEIGPGAGRRGEHPGPGGDSSVWPRALVTTAPSAQPG